MEDAFCQTQRTGVCAGWEHQFSACFFTTLFFLLLVTILNICFLALELMYHLRHGSSLKWRTSNYCDSITNCLGSYHPDGRQSNIIELPQGRIWPIKSSKTLWSIKHSLINLKDKNLPIFYLPFLSLIIQVAVIFQLPIQLIYTAYIDDFSTLFLLCEELVWNAYCLQTVLTTSVP